MTDTSNTAPTIVPITEEMVERAYNGYIDFLEQLSAVGQTTTRREALRQALLAALALPDCHSGMGIVESVVVPRAALAWLFGEGPDQDGNYFGCVPPSVGRPGQYRWRTVLRKWIGYTFVPASEKD